MKSKKPIIMCGNCDYTSTERFIECDQCGKPITDKTYICELDEIYCSAHFHRKCEPQLPTHTVMERIRKPKSTIKFTDFIKCKNCNIVCGIVKLCRKHKKEGKP